MNNLQELKIGFRAFTEVASCLNSTEEISAYFSGKIDRQGQIAVLLIDFLLKYSNKFDSASLCFFTTHNNRIKYRNTPDITIPETSLTDENVEKFSFAYPFKLSYSTFMIRKPGYKPQTFYIFKIFSLSVWTTLLSVLIIMILLYYITLKRKYSFDFISLQVFAVLLRQSSIFKPFSVAENLLVYSWVVGAMFLCLAYDSVFLSFLTIPPVVRISNVAQLARAVENGNYHCFTPPYDSIYSYFSQSTNKNLRIIALDLQRNNLSRVDVFRNFFAGKSMQNLAFLGDVDSASLYGVGEIFVSEDSFLQRLTAIRMQKHFCCKKLIDTFVHRLMASGLHFKYFNDVAFIFKLRNGKSYESYNEIGTNRKLTFTNVAPAFIFLLAGYFISFLAFIGEIILSRKKK